MSDVLRVLREARELITEQRRWTQGSFARNSAGGSTSPRDTDAVCWCAAGAVIKVSGVALYEKKAWKAWEVLTDTSKAVLDENPQFVNDELGHSQILYVFDAAIDAEQAKLASPSP